MAGPVPPAHSSSSVPFVPSFGSFGDFVSLIALLAYSCKSLTDCYRADREMQEMQAYLCDVKGVLELAEEQLATYSNPASIPPLVVDAIRRQLRICTDTVQRFHVRLSAKYPPNTGFALIDRILGHVIDAMTWTTWYRREAHKLRQIVQEHIDLVRPLIEVHNLATPAASPMTNPTPSRPLREHAAVTIGRTPSGSPERIEITLNVPVSELDLSSRQPIAAPPSAFGSWFLHSETVAFPPSSSQVVPAGRRITPSSARVISPLEARALPPTQPTTRPTPSRSSSIDIAEWRARLAPTEGDVLLTHRFSSTNSMSTTTGARPHRPSLPRLNQLRGSRSNTPSPVAVSPTVRVA